MNKTIEFLVTIISIVIFVALLIISMLWFIQKVITDPEQEDMYNDLKDIGHDVKIVDTGFWNNGRVCYVEFNGEMVRASSSIYQNLKKGSEKHTKEK